MDPAGALDDVCRLLASGKNVISTAVTAWIYPLAAGPQVVERAEPPVNVGIVLDALARAHPALERRVRDERGRVRVHVNLFIDADNVRQLDGLQTPIAPGQELSIVPAISGG